MMGAIVVRIHRALHGEDSDRYFVGIHLATPSAHCTTSMRLFFDLIVKKTSFVQIKEIIYVLLENEMILVTPGCDLFSSFRPCLSFYMSESFHNCSNSTFDTWQMSLFDVTTNISSLAAIPSRDQFIEPVMVSPLAGRRLFGDPATS